MYRLYMPNGILLAEFETLEAAQQALARNPYAFVTRDVVTPCGTNERHVYFR